MIYRKESIIIHEKLNMVFEKAQDIATSLKQKGGDTWSAGG